ncbi:MAG: hypothetical protein N0C84_01305 [Candidatus Thiodiazotropha taylori]|uniref:Uncharacterized protein n=1 Tax=Candidatus Thiodiazotropha taylori TaxID=2792791 RepID=A0A9E4N3L1_9GAMM|nr:hypothetical protein [Candidatus Thiodiazotropha taylori]MCW4255084.1 hypothetical protein [Candidatus Thiodiazotropha taylori]
MKKFGDMRSAVEKSQVVDGQVVEYIEFPDDEISVEVNANLPGLNPELKQLLEIFEKQDNGEQITLVEQTVLSQYTDPEFEIEDLFEGVDL